MAIQFGGKLGELYGDGPEVSRPRRESGAVVHQQYGPLQGGGVPVARLMLPTIVGWIVQ